MKQDLLSSHYMDEVPEAYQSHAVNNIAELRFVKPSSFTQSPILPISSSFSFLSFHPSFLSFISLSFFTLEFSPSMD